MIRMLRWATALAGLASAGWLAATLASQEARPTAVDLDAQAVKAYAAKDYARFLELEQQALAADPENPRWAYDVACGEALRGNAPDAVRTLNELVGRQIDFGAETDGDFAGIRQTPEWREFEARLTELRKPVERSQAAFTLDDPGLVATGIAADGRTGDVYIASVRERKIVRWRGKRWACRTGVGLCPTGTGRVPGRGGAGDRQAAGAAVREHGGGAVYGGISERG